MGQAQLWEGCPKLGKHTEYTVGQAQMWNVAQSKKNLQNAQWVRHSCGMLSEARKTCRMQSGSDSVVEMFPNYWASYRIMNEEDKADASKSLLKRTITQLKVITINPDFVNTVLLSK